MVVFTKEMLKIMKKGKLPKIKKFEETINMYRQIVGESYEKRTNN